MDLSDPDSCPRCGDKVFEAEKFPANKRNYHQVSIYLRFLISDCM
jgi:uncharacterized protein YozE (UPF0346 family)